MRALPSFARPTLFCVPRSGVVFLRDRPLPASSSDRASCALRLAPYACRAPAVEDHSTTEHLAWASQNLGQIIQERAA